MAVHEEGRAWFCIAGIWRQQADVGEAFTMLTTEPGPDVAPYHDRQIAIFWIAAPGLIGSTRRFRRSSLLTALPAHTLEVQQVG